MSQSEDEKVDFRSVLSQLKFSNSDDFEQNTALSADSLSSETASSTWVEIYKRYRRPLAPSSWEWSQKSRPGKHCDSHLLDFFACIDKTQDKLVPGEPSEMYCLAARELTAACMAQTLCEKKVFEVARQCPETGDPNKRSQNCWVKIWEAQNCVKHSQILLSKQFWASHPDMLSTADRYLLLLGSPHVPGKSSVGPDFIQRRMEFLEQSLKTQPEMEPGDIKYSLPH